MVLHKSLGINAICSTVSQMLKDAKLDGYFTNHSLRRSGTTRLFQAGVDRKVIKEFTGHSSDAVDSYQITSEGQRREISSILAGECKQSNAPETNKIVDESPKEKSSIVELSINDNTGGARGCHCKLSNMKMSATIKLEVEFSEKKKYMMFRTYYYVGYLK